MMMQGILRIKKEEINDNPNYMMSGIYPSNMFICDNPIQIFNLNYFIRNSPENFNPE